eukprot:1940049-Prymnesium_polylepis.1
MSLTPLQDVHVLYRKQGWETMACTKLLAQFVQEGFSPLCFFFVCERPDGGPHPTSCSLCLWSRSDAHHDEEVSFVTAVGSSFVVPFFAFSFG